MPALNNARGVRVTSNGFDLLQDKEKREGRRITIENVAKDTGLAKMTVRRFLSKTEDVNGSPVAAAAVMAQYFDVSIGDILQIEVESSNAKERVAA